MKIVQFPYGEKFIDLEISQEAEVLLPELITGVADALGEVRKALAQPIGSERLKNLAEGQNSVAIVINDILLRVLHQQKSC